MQKDPLTSNKIMAALLVAVALAWIAGKIAEASVQPRMLEKNVVIVDTGASAQTGSSAPAAPQGPAPVEPLLAKADVAAGEKYARVCVTCHSFSKGEAAKMGPNLYGIVGLKHAHMEGFSYSDAMKAMGDKLWTFDELNQFLYNPKAHIPGTKMSFAGIKGDSDRANVIAWLRTLADNPEPLPK